MLVEGPISQTLESWTDALWRCGPDGQGALLFTGQAIDFRSAPDESFNADSVSAFAQGQTPITLEYNNPEEEGRIFTILE